ncbi:MAG: PQQ-binding-like beta-propeller repeat protein [Candidatus Baltobacteraceae bacterium]
MALHSARSFLVLVGVLALGACNGNGAGFPLGASQAQSSLPATVPGPLNGAASWMARDAETHDLLYVSNRKDGSVYAYSYPQGRLKGWLLNLQASGLCSDRSGDVFIPQGNQVMEYPHGGARTIAVLRNSLGGVSQFCAVDPATGNLAVSGGATHKRGVAIYTGAKGTPRIYSVLNAWSATYDNQGNLFVEAASGSDDAASLLELPKGATQFREVAWNHTRAPRLGSIQWDGKYLAAENSESGSGPATILRYGVSGRQATFVGKIALTGAGHPLQFWIHDGHVVVPNPGTFNSAAGVTLYSYPGGEGPTQTIEGAREPQAATVSPARHRKFAILTYHYDNLRTGWDDKESTLTQANVNSGSFGLLHAVTLDDQVDTQPLLVPDETTTRGSVPGKHDVVYATTENDTVYAIDASSGTVLFQQSLGNPVPTPLGCNNNGPNVGIDGTPVIDKHANAMYVIAYTMQGSVPTYTIHDLSLANLSDIIAPVVVSASHKLSDGSTFAFNATYQRQRPALLEANGIIYAGFGSFCDFSASVSRGWLLGWQAGSLTPLPANQLNDTLATSQDDFFLSSIWMSGYGVAADESGKIYFVTGNSDPSGNSYNSLTNIAESVAKLSPDLTQVLSFFTPSDVGELDQSDADYGSGGVLLLPKVGSQPPLAAAAGKEGTMFLLSRKHLGGYSPSGNHVVDAVNIGGCWCGQSYFDAASDSMPRIVASGGNAVTVWKVPTSRPIKLVETASSPGLPSGQDPGFFTTVSSDGTDPGAIIWALARPQSVPGSVTLFAFSGDAPSSGSTLQTLFQAPAGTWTSGGGNANIVPVVANGKVYVASYAQLDIFGLLGSNGKAIAQAPAIKAPGATIGAPHQVSGTLVAVSGSTLTLRTRTGKMVRVDDADAVRHERTAVLVVGKAFNARGTYDAAGVLHAGAILRVKPSSATWPADR